MVSAPWAFTRPAPMLLPGCQSAIIAPCGSASTDMRPASITSNGPCSTLAPSDSAFSVVASTSSTVT